MSHISDLPLPAQLRFVIDALERDKKERSIKLHGCERLCKMEESDMLLEALHNAKEFLQSPAGKVDVCNND